MDVFELIIIDNPLELVFTDDPLEILVQEDNYTLDVTEDNNEIVIADDRVEILTIAEQGPKGAFGVAIGTIAPSSPSLGDLWLDIN